MFADQEILQLKIRLIGISPMVWRRVLVPASTNLRELPGVLQVGMGWESIHLYHFEIHAVRYGSFELQAVSLDIALDRRRRVDQPDEALPRRALHRNVPGGRDREVEAMVIAARLAASDVETGAMRFAPLVLGGRRRAFGGYERTGAPPPSWSGFWRR